MKNFRITIILVLFIAQTVSVFAQYPDPRLTPFYSVGIYGGSGVVIDEGGMAFREFAAYDPNDSARVWPFGLASSGTGTSGITLFPVEFGLFDLGLTGEIRGRQLLSSTEEQRVHENSEPD